VYSFDLWTWCTVFPLGLGVLESAAAAKRIRRVVPLQKKIKDQIYLITGGQIAQ
jgi:hypothetical protein